MSTAILYNVYMIIKIYNICAQKTKEKERKDSFFEALTAEKYPVLKKFTKSLQNFSRAQRQMTPCSNISFTVLKE